MRAERIPRWNDSLEGQAYFSRVKRLTPFLSKVLLQTPLFSQEFDYPRNHTQLEYYEGFADEDSYDSVSGRALLEQDRVSTKDRVFGNVVRLHDGLCDVEFDCTPGRFYVFNPGVLHHISSPMESNIELSLLIKVRDELAIAADAAPSVGWLEVGKIQRKTTRQVYWRSNVPYSTGKKRIYVGVYNSPAHQRAKAAQAARAELAKIQRQIKEIRNNAQSL
jgi:hypothetical protein